MALRGTRSTLACLVLLLAAEAAAAASCPEVAQPVCGADGLSYYNSCLAKFQGVEVVQQGYCDDSFLSFAEAVGAKAAAAAVAAAKKKHRLVPKERGVEPKQLSEDVMTAFSSDGFIYLGKMQLAKAPSMGHRSSSGSAGAAPPAPADTGLKVGSNGQPLLPAHVSAVRYTPQGDVYIMKQQQAPRVVQERGSVNERGSRSSGGSSSSASGLSVGSSSSGDEAAPVILPNIPPSAAAAAAARVGAATSPAGLPAEAARRAGRSLSIIVGADERKLCPTGAPYPYSAIGQIDFVERNTPYICTGTLLTTSLVLTAAHCVWDIESQTFSDMVTFAPGRYRLPDGKVVSPHGKYKWSHATVMKSYLTSGEGLADIALIKLDGAAPAAAGTMGLKSDCGNSSAEERGLPVTTAGYPSDKLDGECNMALCAVDFNCARESTRHTCDTYMGQSGSAFWDAKFFIRGVHVRGLIDEQANEFTTIGPKVLAKIKEWEAQDTKATAAAIGARVAAAASGKTPLQAEMEGVKAGTAVSAPGLNKAQT